MNVALSSESPPQRVLLRAVTEVLTAQEHAAGRLEIAARALDQETGHYQQTAEPDGEFRDVFRKLLELPEPQLLITDFLDVFAGGLDDGRSLASMAGDLVRTATRRAFASQTNEDHAMLGRLVLVADGGRITPVAEAALSVASGHNLGLASGPDQRRAPRIADLDPLALHSVARALDRATRRQLRLVTMLHGQAEAILRVRRSRRGRLAAVRVRVRNLTSWFLPHHAGFQLGDLDGFVTRFDAIGEVVDAAGECLAEGAPLSSVQLLAGLGVPVPAGLPGRVYHQDCLAQVRPLAMLGIWHRLALAAWATSVLPASAGPGTEPAILAPLPTAVLDFSGSGGGADDQLPYPAYRSGGRPSYP
jgi:hypothetical protein